MAMVPAAPARIALVILRVNEATSGPYPSRRRWRTRRSRAPPRMVGQARSKPRCALRIDVLGRVRAHGGRVPRPRTWASWPSAVDPRRAGLGAGGAQRARGGVRTRTLPEEPRGLRRSFAVTSGVDQCQIMPLSWAFATGAIHLVPACDTRFQGVRSRLVSRTGSSYPRGRCYPKHDAVAIGTSARASQLRPCTFTCGPAGTMFRGNGLSGAPTAGSERAMHAG